MSQINKKPWLRPLLDYFQTIIDFNNRIESIKENLCSISNFNPLKLFIYLDFEKNGFLTWRNIIYFLEQKKTNIEEQYIRSLIHTYDKDGDYNLNFSEFLNIILPVKNKSLKEKLLLLLKEKSDKNIYDILPKEIIILFNELIKEELFFSKTSLYAIKRIYDSPEFTTYDVFIDIVKNESYITKENLSNFLEENNFHLNKDLDINNIMFRIDADNDNKISYPEFQDIFYPLKHLNINYSTNMEKYFSIKEKDKDKDKKKEKEKEKEKEKNKYNQKQSDSFKKNNNLDIKKKKSEKIDYDELEYEYQKQIYEAEMDAFNEENIEGEDKKDE
jgi:Ca2+-binding EF-hand superfamily protein